MYNFLIRALYAKQADITNLNVEKHIYIWTQNQNIVDSHLLFYYVNVQSYGQRFFQCFRFERKQITVAAI